MTQEPFEVIETLKMGLKYLETDGWTTRTLVRLDALSEKVVGRCALGGIGKAAGLTDQEMRRKGACGVSEVPGVAEAALALAETLNYRGGAANPISAVHFNDEQTSFRPVKELFEKTIERLERG